VSSVVGSPCGELLAVVVERLDKDQSRYVSDLWRIRRSDGRVDQLTRGKHSDTQPAWRRDGSLAFLSDRVEEGDDASADLKLRQVWILPPDAGEPRRITDEPLGVSAFAFASAASRLVVASNHRPELAGADVRKAEQDRRKHGPTTLRYTAMPVRFWDHWLPQTVTRFVAFDEEGGARVELTPEAGRELRSATFAVSPDGGRLVFSAAVEDDDRIEDTELVELDVVTLARRTLARAPASAWEGPQFSSDGALLAVSSFFRVRGMATRVGIDVFSSDGTRRAVAGEWDRMPTLWGFGADDATVLCTADDGGDVPVFSVDLATGTPTRLTSLAAGGSHSHLCRFGAGLAMVRSTLIAPPEVYALDPETTEPRPLTTLSGLRPELASTVTVERCEVASTDGAPIPYFVLRPAAPPAPMPAVIWIHGGPVGAWGDTWHWRWCGLAMASAGYTMVLPNPRGSTGYGYGFIDPIWGNRWGGQCYEDVMAVADAVAARPDVDGARMAAMGGSFGGYMTNWIGTQTDRFAALVTHASAYHMSAFAATTDFPAWWNFSFATDPYGAPEELDRYSPSHHMDGWRSPTLVLHGERDYRVPIGEALALFEALQHHKVESELVVFPDENHWILRPRNIVAWYAAVQDFLARHL